MLIELRPATAVFARIQSNKERMDITDWIELLIAERAERDHTTAADPTPDRADSTGPAGSPEHNVIQTIATQIRHREPGGITAGELADLIGWTDHYGGDRRRAAQRLGVILRNEPYNMVSERTHHGSMYDVDELRDLCRRLGFL